MESTGMILEVTLMTTLNRRRFVEVAGSSLLFESVHAGGFPLPAGAQRFLLHMGQSEKNNPYGSVIQKLERMTGVAITGWKTHADNLPHPEAVTLTIQIGKTLSLCRAASEGQQNTRRAKARLGSAS